HSPLGLNGRTCTIKHVPSETTRKIRFDQYVTLLCFHSINYSYDSHLSLHSPCAEEFFAHSGTVTSAAFSRSTQSLLATGGDDRIVHLWNLDPSLYDPVATFAPAPSEIECLAFNTDET